MSLRTQTHRDAEDIVLQINGEVAEGQLGGKSIYEVKEGYVGVRVDRILYAVESGVKVHLHWQGSGDHIITLEGRGIIDAEKFGGLMNPRNKDWSGGIGLSAEGAKGHFTLILDLYKQRS